MTAPVEPGEGSMDGERRFGGVARLYGQQALERLAAARVCVVGVGGVGSWAVEALARSGVGHLTLIDLDQVCESNVNRQLHALEADFGLAKVQALARRIQGINPAARVLPVEAFVEPDTLDQWVTAEFDILLDCIDGYRNKAALIAHCRQLGLPLVCAGGAGGLTNPEGIRVADLSQTSEDPLLAKTRRLLRTDYAFPRNPQRRFGVPCVYSPQPRGRPPAPRAPRCAAPADAGMPGSGLNCAGYGSVVTVTASFGLMAAAYALNQLAGKKLQY
jgi:tRNA A37 threonylcarbamoyladenosine dehydratase